MEFCCTLKELENFTFSSKKEEIKVTDYVDLKSKVKEKDFVQQEFDFNAPVVLEKKIIEKKIIKPSNIQPQVYIPKKERNMELMIKYKYDTITKEELDELYLGLERLIYKIIKSNYVTENFNDVCNEIWRRIAKYKHKWDETKGDYVTTWVGKVAMNVINTLRKRTMTYRSRNVSLDGMVTCDKGGEEKPVDMEQLVADNHDESGERRKKFYDNLMDCFDLFNDTEKEIIKLFLESNPENLVLENEDRTYKRRYASASFIKKKLNLTQNEYNNYIKSIGEKYVSKQKQIPNDGIDYRVLYRIF